MNLTHETLFLATPLLPKWGKRALEVEFDFVLYSNFLNKTKKGRVFIGYYNFSVEGYSSQKTTLFGVEGWS